MVRNLEDGILGRMGAHVVLDVSMDAVECIERLEAANYDVLLVPSFIPTQQMWVADFATLIRDMNNSVAIFYFHPSTGCTPAIEKHVAESQKKLDSFVRFDGGQLVRLVDGKIDDPADHIGWLQSHQGVGMVLARHMVSKLSCLNESKEKAAESCLLSADNLTTTIDYKATGAHATNEDLGDFGNGDEDKTSERNTIPFLHPEGVEDGFWELFRNVDEA